MFQKTRGRKTRTKWTPLDLTNSQDCLPLPAESSSGETAPDCHSPPAVQGSTVTHSPQQKQPEQGSSAGPPSTAAVPQEAWAVPGETESDWPNLAAAQASTSSSTPHSSVAQDSPLTSPFPSQQTRSYAVAAALPTEMPDEQAWRGWYYSGAYFGVPLPFEGRTNAEILAQVQQIEITSQQVSNEESCLICFEDNYTLGEKVYQLPCKHCYHRQCLISWLRQHNTCPLCRAKALKMDEPTQPYDASLRRQVPTSETQWWLDWLQGRYSWVYR